MGILAVENALIARIQQVLGDKVRKVGSLPGDWDDDMLKRLLRAVPGVFVVYPGGSRSGAVSTSVKKDAQWIVYVVTGHASGEAARRRGDSQQVGAYELLDTLEPALHGFTVADEGTFAFERDENLYTGRIDTQGIAVYAITLQMLTVVPNQVDGSTLDDFETFDAQYDIPPHTPGEHAKWLNGDYSTSNPDAHDTVTLPTS